jgi:hypothetical protein
MPMSKSFLVLFFKKEQLTVFGLGERGWPLENFGAPRR